MKRCMIVDDSGVIRKVAKRILATEGMLVVEAESGNQALFMCEAQMPDYIILDASLPDCASPDFIRQVLTLDEKKRPHVILLMTEFDIGTFMRAKRAGASAYLLKPFTRAHIVDRFRKLSIAA